MAAQEEWTQTVIQEILYKQTNKKNHTFSYCEGGQTVPQTAKRGCGAFILGDPQNPTGHSPGQPARFERALKGQLEVPFSFNYPTSCKHK